MMSPSPDSAVSHFRIEPLEPRVHLSISDSILLYYVPSVPMYSLGSAGDTAIFVEDDGTHGPEVWRTDGTSKGTYLLKDINPSDDFDPEFVGQLGGRLCFSAKDETGVALWITDGTIRGTSKLRNVEASEPGIEMGKFLFFAGTTRGRGAELWRTDGTTDGTILVRDIVPGKQGSSPYLFGAFDGKVYFSVRKDATQIWSSGGTKKVTTRLANLPQATGEDVFVDRVVNTPGHLLFTATHFSKTYSKRSRLFSIGKNSFNVISAGKEFLDFDVLFGKVYFTVDGQLWRTTGSPDKTHLLAKGDYRYFAGSDNASDRLFVQNGRSAGMIRNGKVTKMSFVNTSSFFGVQRGNELYYRQVEDSDSIYEIEHLWKTDGTAGANAKLFAGDEQAIGAMFTLNGKFCFVAETRSDHLLPRGESYTGDQEFWTSDGTKRGTKLVKSIIPSRDIHNFASQGWILVKNRLVFELTEPAHGREMWVFDGTSKGTHMIRDVYPGPGLRDDVFD